MAYIVKAQLQPGLKPAAVTYATLPDALARAAAFLASGADEVSLADERGHAVAGDVLRAACAGRIVLGPELQVALPGGP